MKNHKYIKTALNTIIDDICVEHFSTIGSTNDYLLEREISHKYHFCYAERQTKGRGRRGDKWISDNNDNIYSTLAFSCNFNITEDSFISIKVALGVLETIKKYIPVDRQEKLKIKLPNDIYFEDHKLAGILIETKNIKKDSFDIVIGIGINVNMTNIKEDIDRQWTSLSIINNYEIDSSKVIVDLVRYVINNFEKSYLDTLEAFSKYDYTLNRKITFNYSNKNFQGIARGITDNLMLKILDDNNNLHEFDLANISKIRVIK
ncbi:biotin--[acetyl-CoA-carboxylase] ligase [Francisella philomiragia]|uniref:biotin--[acetyl-CoA-carboxylase] ligase n=1 Tax=Francisella philomiragia TaxID=28110 RepID=UPI001C9DE5A9|nr:biotin--[acetyl-CoA-carboxylase] ligase [Francisella philomiragia]MBY7735152.1 biotin--[acetyl-CoA-carboxylase] ligase [Francisella philomiragia]